MLCAPRIVRDAGAANSKREGSAGGDGVGIRGGCSERYAVDLGVRGDRDVGGIRKSESRNIRWPIGNPHWRPVRSRIPVARGGIEIPLGALRVGNPWKQEHQRAADRCDDKCSHRSNLWFCYRCERLLSCWAPASPFWKPNSPQTSSSFRFCS